MRLPARRPAWSEIDPEQRGALLLVGSIAAIVVAALALVAYGYYNERIQSDDDETVLRVGSRDFDYDYLQRRLLGLGAPTTQDSNQIAQTIVQVLSMIEREELLRQSAKRLGISVSDEEIEERMRARMSLGADVSRQDFASRLRQELVATGLSLAEFREIAESEALSNKIRAQYESAIPPETEHVELRVIELETQAQALQAQNRINAGESPATVAAEMTGNQSASGLTWVPKGSLEPQVEEWAFNNTGVSGIIETNEAFYILESRSKAVRAVDASAKNSILSRQMANVISETKKEVGSTTLLNSSHIQQLALTLGNQGA
jgi:parvulin-like peptidyl-prolyl isomerase